MSEKKRITSEDILCYGVLALTGVLVVGSLVAYNRFLNSTNITLALELDKIVEAQIALLTPTK